MKKIIYVILLVSFISGIYFYTQQPEKIAIGDFAGSKQLELEVIDFNAVFSNSSDQHVHIFLEGYNITPNQIKIVEENGKLLVTSLKQSGFVHLRKTPNLIIQLPSAVEKTFITSKNGDIYFHENRLVSLTIQSQTGDINIDSATANTTKLQTQYGQIKLVDNNFNEANIHSVSGDIFLQGGTGSDYLIQTKNGAIKWLQALEIPIAKLQSETGDIQLAYASPPISLKSLVVTEGDKKILLKEYNAQTNSIGEGLNQLKVDSKYGAIVIK